MDLIAAVTRAWLIRDVVGILPPRWAHHTSLNFQMPFPRLTVAGFSENSGHSHSGSVKSWYRGMGPPCRDRGMTTEGILARSSPGIPLLSWITGYCSHGSGRGTPILNHYSFGSGMCPFRAHT